MKCCVTIYIVYTYNSQATYNEIRTRWLLASTGLQSGSHYFMHSTNKHIPICSVFLQYSRVAHYFTSPLIMSSILLSGQKVYYLTTIVMHA